MTNSEVEGKLIIVSERPWEVAARLSGLDGIDGFAFTNRQIHQIRDVYFDTENRDLASRKVALRTRKEDGQEKITVKGEATKDLDVNSRPELELDWSEAAFRQAVDAIQRAGVQIQLPQIQPRVQAEEALGAAGLRSSSVRTTRRTSLAVESNDNGQRVAELAVDDVTFLAAGTAVRHFELECEAKAAGNSQTVQHVMDELKRNFPNLHPYEYSKLDIAEALENLAMAGKLALLLKDGVLRPEAYEEIRRVLRTRVR